MLKKLIIVNSTFVKNDDKLEYGISTKEIWDNLAAEKIVFLVLSDTNSVLAHRELENSAGP